MQKAIASKEPTSNASKALFSRRAAEATPFFTPMIQAKCVACEEQDQVQRKSEPAIDDHEPVQLKPSDSGVRAHGPPTLQAKCACGDEGLKLQPKLTLGTPGDRFEQEADRTADTVMRSGAPIGQISAAEPAHLQRDGAETCKFEDEKEKDEEDEEKEDPVPGEEKFEEKEEKVSPKRAESGGGLSTSFELRMDATRGGGVALGGETREFMESRFGYDFSGVRIHTGAHAGSMNRDIRSHAFTSGSDIYFDSGQYRPETELGRHLLAHELTHVVQQTRPRGESGLVREKGDTGVVSRAIDPPESKWYYGHRVSGTQVHGELEKILRGADPQKDLVTEAAIPGANRKGAALNKIGVADLYKSTPPKKVTGIKGYNKVASLEDLVSMNSPEVTDTQPLREIEKGPELTLPVGVKKGKGVKRELTGHFPESVTLGEIKPADTSKLADGWAQLDHYEQGYQAFVKQIHKVTGGKTRPSIVVNRLKLTLPDALDFDKFESSNKTPFGPATFKDRRLWVAEVGLGSGIYLYDDLAAKGLPPGQPADWQQKYRPRLLKVRADLTIKHPGSSKMGQRKSISAGPPVVQRKGPDKRVQWEAERKEFAKEFRGELNTKHRNFRDKLRFEKKLGKAGKSLPERQKAEVKEYKSLMFWSGFGGKVLGRVRFMLGGVWDKAVEIFEKMKEKMHGVRKKVRDISDSKVAGVSWAKRLIKVVVAASKVAVTAFIMESFNFFSDCFQSGMDKVVKKFQDDLINTKLGQKLCHARKDYLAFKDRLEAEWNGGIKQLEELFELVQNTTRWIEIATTVIDLIRLGVQVISCLTPPALGCLWGLVVQVGISAALGIVVGTQWFNDEIVTPQVRKLVRKYAAPHYQSFINRVLGDKLEEYHCDVSKPFDVNNFEYKEVGIKAGTKEMDDHRAQWEKDNESQMIADLQKVFVKKDGTPVTKENLHELVRQIQEKKLNVGQIKTVLNQARDAASSKLDVDSATQLATQGAIAVNATTGNQLAKKRDIDYPKATRSNLALQKMHGWDPMAFYKQPILKVDSEEFANAIYDLQESMTIKADGILGDETLIAFYDRNKIKKDLAYKESVESMEKARVAAEEARKEAAGKHQSKRDQVSADKADGSRNEEGFKVVNAADVKRKQGALGNRKPNGIRIFIHTPAVDSFIQTLAPKQLRMHFVPSHLTLDIYVNDKPEYRVVNVELQGVDLQHLLMSADSTNEWLLVVFFRDGIEIQTPNGELSLGGNSWWAD